MFIFLPLRQSEGKEPQSGQQMNFQYPSRPASIPGEEESQE